MSKLTRRGFAAMTVAGGASAAALAQQPTREITAASVPGDPIAPGPQEGTLPEEEPFRGPLHFTRKDVTPRVQPFAGADVRLLTGQVDGEPSMLGIEAGSVIAAWSALKLRGA
jgi:hypothetical protein